MRQDGGEKEALLETKGIKENLFYSSLCQHLKVITAKKPLRSVNDETYTTDLVTVKER